MNYIDPVTQVLMDFYADTHAENVFGTTRMVDYEGWAKKIRTALFFDCACHESWREGIVHSKYECYGDKYGVLRAGIAYRAKKEVEKELFEDEQKLDIPMKDRYFNRKKEKPSKILNDILLELIKQIDHINCGLPKFWLVDMKTKLWEYDEALNGKCRCACHDDPLKKKKYQHDSWCCSNMQGHITP